MSWDGLQREILAELGLRAYTLAGPATEGAEAGQAPSTGAATLPPGLLAALARAAACTPSEVMVLTGLTCAPSDAAARRALWPRLRRLRTRAR